MLLQIGAAGLLLACADRIFDRMPTHWNLEGVADRFQPKSPARVRVVPVIGLGGWLALAATMVAAATRDPPPHGRGCRFWHRR